MGKIRPAVQVRNGSDFIKMCEVRPRKAITAG